MAMKNLNMCKYTCLIGRQDVHIKLCVILF